MDIKEFCQMLCHATLLKENVHEMDIHMEFTQSSIASFNLFFMGNIIFTVSFIQNPLLGKTFMFLIKKLS